MPDEFDKAWADYSKQFRESTLPKMLDSAVFLSIGTNPGEFDVKQATELGAALLMDKPLLLVVPTGRQIGARLRRAADEIVEDWNPNDPGSQVRFSAALKRLNI